MRKGPLAAVGAYLSWGILPVYWKLIERLPATEILAHRVVWSLLFVLVLLGIRRQWDWVRTLRRNPRRLLLFASSAIILALNWYTYIWAVNADHIVEASLGYFINPLFSILLGVIFLGERLKRLQIIAVSIAALGVLYLTISYGSFPWIALTLTVTFGFYGLIRKTSSLKSLPGLTVEMVVLFLPALWYLGLLQSHGTAAFGHGDLLTNILLALTGVATAIPLILFAYGAQHTLLSTVGILQYIAPTLQFILGVFVYHEPFPVTKLIGFLFIWTALIIYSYEIFIRNKRRPAMEVVPPE